MFGKIPWITEAEIWKTLPKTSRVPTGGWRGYSAVPSHSYPYPAVLPNGYWQGYGLVPSVYDPQCQAAKTMQGFGATTATPTPTTKTPLELRLEAARARDAGNLNLATMLEAEAKRIEDAQKSATSTAAWTGALQAIVQAGTNAYTAYQTSQAQEAAIKAGVPLQAFQTTPANVAVPPAPAAGGSKTLLYVGAAVGLGLIAVMALRR